MLTKTSRFSLASWRISVSNVQSNLQKRVNPSLRVKFQNFTFTLKTETLWRSCVNTHKRTRVHLRIPNIQFRGLLIVHGKRTRSPGNARQTHNLEIQIIRKKILKTSNRPGQQNQLFRQLSNSMRFHKRQNDLYNYTLIVAPFAVRRRRIRSDVGQAAHNPKSGGRAPRPGAPARDVTPARAALAPTHIEVVRRIRAPKRRRCIGWCMYRGGGGGEKKRAHTCAMAGSTTVGRNKEANAEKDNGAGRSLFPNFEMRRCARCAFEPSWPFPEFGPLPELVSILSTHESFDPPESFSMGRWRVLWCAFGLRALWIFAENRCRVNKMA